MQNHRIVEAEAGGACFRFITNPVPVSVDRLQKSCCRLAEDALRDGMAGLGVFYCEPKPAAAPGVAFFNGTWRHSMPEAAIVCAAEVAIAERLIRLPSAGPVQVQTPNGLVEVHGGAGAGARVYNTSGLVLGVGYPVRLPRLGVLRADMVFDGEFYAVMDATPRALHLPAQMIAASTLVCQQIAEQDKITHPTRPDACGLSRVIWPLPPRRSDATLRSVVVETAPVPRIIPDVGLAARTLLRTVLGQSAWGQPQYHETAMGQLLTAQSDRLIITAERPGGSVLLQTKVRLREMAVMGGG